jgi:hypothetical protein
MPSTPDLRLDGERSCGVADSGENRLDIAKATRAIEGTDRETTWKKQHEQRFFNLASNSDWT